jgi:UDP-2-acetamido-3-amino-2,3-dideoxy-glucuronate N-acetyltransferase
MPGIYHPTAIVESNQVGPDTHIWAFAHVLPGAHIGRNCNIGDHAFVEGGAVIGNNVTLKNHVCVWEGVTIEADVFVGPFVAFTNDLYPRSRRMPLLRARGEDERQWLVPTVVERGCSIGANATIIAGTRIGRFAMVGAGSVVTSDVEPFALVVGNPAHKIGYVCRCGRPTGPILPSADCPQCGASPKIFRRVDRLPLTTLTKIGAR